MVAALIVLLCFFIGPMNATSDCPSKEDMFPCECSVATTDRNDVECRFIQKPEELILPMQSLRRSKTRVHALKIKNSVLPHFPNNLFKDTHIEEVHFVNTKIISFTEYGTAFNGLENFLTCIEADNVDFVSGLHLHQLRNLKNLWGIICNRCRMHSAIHDFPLLPEFNWLEIRRSEISYISNRAFIDLPDLYNFDMRGNKITEMKRSMFSKPAKDLKWINLRDNMLSSLPSDFFENMPSLKVVYLSRNKFVTLSAKPFSDALKNHGLEIFFMEGNPIHCDCKLSWLGNIRFPKHFSGQCATPEDLSGKSISALDFQSLRLKICSSENFKLLLAFMRFPMQK